MESKFTTCFHESFSLSRSALQIILDSTVAGRLDKELLKNSPLGTNYQKAMPRYAYRAGLLDKNNRLTLLGRFVIQHDPTLEKTGTQWLMHYHLAAPHGPTAFWHHLVVRRFLPGNIFTDQDLITDLTIFLREQSGKAPSPRSVRSTVTVFLGTYLKNDGLKRLGLLEENDGHYRVCDAPPPPVWALGYALVDFWQAHYGERLTVNLDDLASEKFASLFLLGEKRLTDLLIELKQEGMIDLYRIAHPYQVVLLQPNPEYALMKLFAV